MWWLTCRIYCTELTIILKKRLQYNVFVNPSAAVTVGVSENDKSRVLPRDFTLVNGYTKEF